MIMPRSKTLLQIAEEAIVFEMGNQIRVDDRLKWLTDNTEKAHGPVFGWK